MNSAIEKRVKRHIKANAHDFFAVYPPGFTESSLAEMSRLNTALSVTNDDAGISFTGKMDSLYEATLLLRGSVRILMRIKSFHAENFRELKRKTSDIPWDLFCGSSSSFEFSVSSSKSRLYHSGAIMETLKESIPTCANPAVKHTIFARITDDRCTLSIDTSGDPLYKRGFRIFTPDAPLRENICSMLLHEAGIKDCSVFIDPMCGGGTFSLEAASALGMIPLFHPQRKFAFQDFPAYSRKSFSHFTAKLSPARGNCVFLSSDINSSAVENTISNFANASFTPNECSQSDFFSLKKPGKSDGLTILALNPPYGKRIESSRNLFVEIRNKLSKDFKGVRCVIVTPDIYYPVFSDSFSCRRFIFSNGGIKVSAAVFAV